MPVTGGSRRISADMKSLSDISGACAQVSGEATQLSHASARDLGSLASGRATCPATAPSDDSANIVLQALFSDANQELSGLLHDVRAGILPNSRASGNPRQMGELLMRAVRLAAKQFVLQEGLKDLALKDELTGLYNRRSFNVLAERQLKIALRSGRGMLLFFIDVDGLKEINDTFGHAEGDRVLKRAAKILEKTFRVSDVIARLGGDEFAVLAVEASGHSEAHITARLAKYANPTHRAEGACSFSLSVGVARFDHGKPSCLRDLMALADQSMYERKKRRRVTF